MSEIAEVGRGERSEGLIKAELKKMLQSKDAVKAWAEELRLLRSTSQTERNLDRAGIVAKVEEAQSALVQWKEYAHDSFAILDKENLTDEEQEFVHSSLDEIDAIVSEFEREIRRAA
jgi:hypothetical protein